MNHHPAMHRFERWLLGKYNFVHNVYFFLSLGYGLKRAWNAARNTL